MKTLFYIIIFVIVFLFTANTQITFKPFSISLPYWYKPVGLLLVVIGIFVFGIGENMSEYKRGYKDGINKTIELIKKIEDENDKGRN